MNAFDGGGFASRFGGLRVDFNVSRCTSTMYALALYNTRCYAMFRNMRCSNSVNQIRRDKLLSNVPISNVKGGWVAQQKASLPETGSVTT